MDQENGVFDCPYILVAEDDPDDQFLLKEAYKESGIVGNLHFVSDGQELTDFLFRRGKYASSPLPFLPACIILDLNMPRKNGRDALFEIKQDSNFKDIDIIVFTTSNSSNDKRYCSELGVKEYVSKPDEFASLIELMRHIEKECLSNPIQQA